MKHKIIRVGEVSSTNSATMTVRVVFPDEGNSVSDDLSVINRGSKNNKDYWMPDVGEQVICIFTPNSRNRGFVLGSFFSSVDVPPIGSAQNKRILEHKGDLEIRCTGNIKITGARIDLNEG